MNENSRMKNSINILSKNFFLIIITQFLIRSISVEINFIARTRKNNREKMLNEVSNALMNIFDHDINRDCKKSSISKKSLIDDTNNIKQFYASKILKKSFNRSLIMILIRFVIFYFCQFKLLIFHNIAVFVLINTYIAVHILFKKLFFFACLNHFFSHSIIHDRLAEFLKRF